MTHEEHRSAFAFGDVLHLADGFLLELSVADGEDFVHHQDLGVKESCYGEAQTDGHTARIALHRGVQVTLAAREIYDLVQLSGDLLFGHAEDSAVQENILPTCHLSVEARADLEQAGDASAGADRAHGRASDLTEEFQERRFAGAVLADDAYDVALLDTEVDIAERPDVVGVGLGGTVVDRADLEVGVILTQDGGLPPAVEVVAEGACGHEAQAVLFADVVEFDCCCHCCLYIYIKSKTHQLSSFILQRLKRCMSSRLNRR